MKLYQFIAAAILILVNAGCSQNAKTTELIYLVDGVEMSEMEVNNIEPHTIKSMDKGVSEDKKEAFYAKYGKEADPSLVVNISLFTDQELKDKRPKTEAELAAEARAQKEIEEKATLIHVGDIAPNFTVTMLDGSSYTLSDLKGKVVLLNFWATWCGPCMQEFKVLPNQIVNRFSDDNFLLLPISRGEKTDVVAKKMTQLKKSGIDFPVGLDLNKSIYNEYATSYIPRNFLIDQSGKVVYTSVGYSEKEFAELITKISELLE